MQPTPQLYLSPTPHPTIKSIPPVGTPILPTPTPIIYSVVKGDTFSSIANHFGITVDALQSANPSVKANALTVGMKLTIPPRDEGTGETIPTPAALPVTQARCWTEATGGLWCFALVRNEYAETIENLSAQFSLLDASGAVISSQITYGLLDILPAGQSMPLAAHFPAPTSANPAVRVEVLTAIRLLPGDSRYLPLALENPLTSVEVSGRTAVVSGKIRLTGSGTAKSLWILAVAYDPAGNVIGIRRWEAPAVVTDASPASFELQVSSVGPSIDRVDLLAEARP